MQKERSIRKSVADLWKQLQSRSFVRFGLYGILILLAVGFYFAGTDRLRCESRAGPTDVAAIGESTSGDTLEKRLVKVLSQIRGAGRVEVLVTYETTGEIVTAMSVKSDEDVRDAITGTDSTTQRSTSTVTEPATVKGGDGQTPIILVEKEPVVRGVIVVAEGAAQLSVRRDLQNAVRAATGVPLSHIEVFEMTVDAYNETE
ncbi:MAG: hypothetical protein IJK01_00535 [Clostridia bacterium]|nr:hypothetical protein [Clostridia bacterium]